jgi:hypothetical protein
MGWKKSTFKVFYFSFGTMISQKKSQFCLFHFILPRHGAFGATRPLPTRTSLWCTIANASISNVDEPQKPFSEK